MTLNSLPIRCEDVVTDQKAKVMLMLNFVGAPFCRRCLKSHENKRYARTASYAHVTEPLYDRSFNRYRHHLKHLAPVIPILEPIILRLGNCIDG